MAQPINFFYRGATAQGTFVGGCISCCASIFFAIFVIIQLSAWLFYPDFNELMSVKYLDKGSAVLYEIPIESFLPTITICDDYKKAIEYGDSSICNDPDHWSIHFLQFNDDGSYNLHDAISCIDLIDSMTGLTP